MVFYSPFIPLIFFINIDVVYLLNMAFQKEKQPDSKQTKIE